MRRTLGFLLALNVGLALAFAAAPQPAEAVATEGWMNCCKTSVEGDPFCCVDCCWVGHLCIGSPECQGGPS